MFKRIALYLFTLTLTVAAAGIGYLSLRKPAQAPPSNIKVPMTPGRIARGKYLFEVVADCGGCHSEHDLSRIAFPIAPSGVGRGIEMSAVFAGLPGTVVAPNLTPDRETGLGAWSDGEKIRAIREGIDRNGRALFPMMPYESFRHMSDEDAESLVAYMNTLPPVRNPLPATKLSFPISLMINGAPKPAGSVPPPDRSDRLKYGEYLVTLAGCAHCHTQTERGQPVSGKEFAGGEKFEAPAIGTVYSANITPDMETGIGKWSEDFFVKKIHDYRDYVEKGSPRMTGREQFTVMPWLAFCRMSNEELGAIYTYLRTLKPVRNAVETHPKS
jgi:mono/diheme cytochrome c family protein